MEATDTVIVAGIVVTGSTLIRDVKQNKPKTPPIIFGFMLVTGLLLLAIPLPKVAKGLSVLALVGAFVVNGPVLFSTASGLTSSKAPTESGANTLPPGTTKRAPA